MKKKKNFEYKYKNNPIYAIGFPQGGESIVSFGNIDGGSGDNKAIFTHTCDTEFGSSGSPIISLKSFKVFAIHSGFFAKYSTRNKCVIILPATNIY